ncbi:hypothetical protein ACQ4PT_033926 [Festuca glaucescens]
MPPTHRGNAAAASTGSIWEASVGGVVTEHCDNSSTASTGSIGDALHKPAAASIGVVRTVHRGKVATVRLGKAAATTVSIASTWEMLQKKAAAESAGGSPMAHPRKGPAVAGSSGKMSQKQAAGDSTGGMPTTRPRKGPVVTGRSGKIPQKNATASRGGSPHGGKEAPSRLRAAIEDLGPGTRLPAAREGKHKNSGSRMHSIHALRATIDAPALGSLTNVLNQIDQTIPSLGALHGKKYAPKHHPDKKTPKGFKEKADTASSQRGSLQKHRTTVKSDIGLGGQLLHTSASREIYNGSTTAKGSTTSAAKHHTMKACAVSSAKMPQKKMHKTDKADMGLCGGKMLRKKSSKLEAHTGLSGDILHKNSANGVATATDFDSNKITGAADENVRLQEAQLLIRKLNELGRGEDISREDFLQYYDRLPPPLPWIDTDVELKDGKLNEQALLHARYRFRYCKHKLSQKVPKKELHGDIPEEDYFLYHFDGRFKEDDLQDISEEDCSVKFLKEQGYFKHFEEDGTLDWFFHPRYLDCDLLNDYQRLVPRNYGGTEYARWSEYHKYLHSYRIEQEYVEYCEELFKQLEWMEDYLHFDRPSFKWDYISSRGALQAIKIAATCFTEISATLAYNGYYECTESMSYDLTWFKELDGVYFEIWLRVTQGLQCMTFPLNNLLKSFKDALVEVYHLNRFPLRQNMMKHALDFDDSMEEMEEQVKEDQAQKLIREAVKKLVNKPKTYEQYIRKKIDIARIVRIPLED